ncbi:MAG: TAXI family TRAP transporter solute-binding subunit [Pseudomonadota bacterium]
MTMMSRRLAAHALAAAGLLSAALVAPAAAQQPDRLTLVTGAPGGSWYGYSAGIAQIFGEAGVPTTPEQGGANSNILNVAAGNADFGFTQTNANFSAQQGKGAFREPVTGVMGLTVLFPQFAHTVVTVESGVTSYDQLKGQRMASQSMAAGSRQIFDDTLRAYGLNGEDDLEIVVRGGPGVGASAVRDRQAIGFVATTNPPTSSVSEVAASLPIRLLPISDGAFEELLAINPGYGRGVIPAGSYPGVDEDVPTLVDDTVLIAPASLPDDHAYWIVKTLAENAERVAALGPALRGFGPEMMPHVAIVDLHPGARRYYEEVGLLP